MTRILLVLILLLGPLFLYWSYISFVARKQKETGGHWNELPMALLLSIGFVLAMSALLYTSYSNRAEPGTTYVPSRTEDGVLVPGRVVPRDENIPDGSGGN